MARIKTRERSTGSDEEWITDDDHRSRRAGILSPSGALPPVPIRGIGEIRGSTLGNEEFGACPSGGEYARDAKLLEVHNTSSRATTDDTVGTDKKREWSTGGDEEWIRDDDHRSRRAGIGEIRG